MKRRDWLRILRRREVTVRQVHVVVNESAFRGQIADMDRAIARLEQKLSDLPKVVKRGTEEGKARGDGDGWR